MSAVRHADFKRPKVDHLGAPEYHDGEVYTFAKIGAYPPMRLVWFDAADLSYKPGSFRELTIRTAPDGRNYVTEAYTGRRSPRARRCPTATKPGGW